MPTATATKKADTKPKAKVMNGDDEKPGRLDFLEVKKINPENADPKVYPFDFHDVNGTKTATPVGFSYRDHKQLGSKDFATRSAFFTYRAEKSEYESSKWRTRASEESQFGDGKSKAAAKKLTSMKAKMDELMKTLAAQGVDVQALLASTKPTQPAAAA